MNLGLMLGYSGAEMALPVEVVQRAEALGFDSVWTAEAYGSDATSPLAYLAALTKRIRLGTSIMQLAGRPPASGSADRRSWKGGMASSGADPDEYCYEGALVGPAERIRERYRAWEGSGASGLIMASMQPEAMELMADLVGSRDSID